MRGHAEIVESLVDPGLIAVIRTSQPAQVPAICEALIAGGIRALEITLTVPNACEIIQAMREQAGHHAIIGAGTVLTATSAREALTAGAEFIVTPILRPEIVSIAHEQYRPVMLGAYTPTEAQSAHEAGADFVKIFPADKLGPGYIKNLLAPLPHLKIVPTGGVDLNTIGDFMKAGCAALGVGSSLLNPELLRAENWDELSRKAAQFVEAIKIARPTKFRTSQV